MCQASTSAPAGASPVLEKDPEALARYLLSFRWADRNEEVHKILVSGGLPLWRQILELVPDPPERGRALELGSPPFHITLLLQRFRNYELSLTGFASDGRSEITQRLVSDEYGEEFHFRCTCFDAERDRFPYDDNTFDLVTWSEVIEHLTENPVHALAEIHRVLKPGGALVISTPNATRVESVFRFLAGRNIYDPYHLGAPLKGSRHSREYTFLELCDLVTGCGYAVDRAEDVDIYHGTGWKRAVLRVLLNNVVARVTGGRYRFHLFVRATKTEKLFRWYFPTDLFDQGHLAFYMTPRDHSVVMGENDQIHIAMGWGELRTGPDGKAMRRSGDVGDIYLRTASRAECVTLSLSNGSGEAQAWINNGDGDVLLGKMRFDAAPGRWQDVIVALAAGSDPEAVLHVRLDAHGGVDVHAVAVE